MKWKVTSQILNMTKYAFFGIVLQGLLSSMLLAHEGSAQKKSIEEVFVNINLEDASLSDAFMEIERNTEFRFVYSQGVLQKSVNISIDSKQQSLGDILRELSKQAQVRFKRIDENIHVSQMQNLQEEVLQETISVPQQVKISGKVTASEDNEPLPGVSILVKGTSSGTTTDIEGNYSISAPEGSILQFSYIGFVSQEITVGSQTTLNITLQPDLEQLEEVIVVGYGTTKKSDITGSVASVKSEDLVAFPAFDATQALQGRAAGVQISSVNGAPGDAPRIRVRGGTSINASSDPLIVVDGLVGAVLPPPEDISSMEILKDASSTAIYGSRGANGVILVTTKKGSSGKARVNFNTSYSTQEVINTMDLLDREQFIDYSTDALGVDYIPYSDGNGSNYNTDWQDEIFTTGGIQNYNLNVAGGTDKVKYFFSGSVFDQEGIIINSGFQRYSLTSNVDAKLSDKVSVGTNLFVRHTDRQGVATQETSGGGGADTGVITAALSSRPDRPIVDDQGNFVRSGFATDFDNPFAVATERVDDVKQDLLQGNSYVNIEVIEGLSFKSTLGFSLQNRRSGLFFPTTLVAGSANGSGQVSNSRATTLLNENFLTYDKELGNGNLNVVGGYSFQRIQNESYRVSAQEFAADDFSFFGIGGALPLDINNGFSETEIQSWFGRVNYSFADKYLFTFTGRADGSSNFAANNKWAFFPSAAFAWRISEEAFLSSVDFLSDAKLRLSYGLTGNQAIAPYQSLGQLTDNIGSGIGGAQVTAVTLNTIGNKELTWETTRQLNIGLNVGVLDDRITFEADYYRMVTEDLLFPVVLPTEAGIISGRVLTNLGEVENKGFEFMLNSKNLVGEFKWDMSFNISVNRNKILSLPDGDDVLFNSAPGGFFAGNTSIIREGQPIGTFYGYIFDGINDGSNSNTFEFDEDGNPLPGGVTFKDTNGRDDNGELTGTGDGVLNGDDQTIIGDPNPDFIWGFNNTFSYKGFDLNIFLQASVGGDIYNLSRMEIDQLTGEGNNVTTDALNRYSSTNTNTDVPVANLNRPLVSSSRFVEDGSFVRLRNIALGYTFPSDLLEKIHLSSARIYVSAQNILTITDYKGFDPEVNYDKNNNATTRNAFVGLDYSSFPLAKGYTVGLNIGF